MLLLKGQYNPITQPKENRKSSSKRQRSSARSNNSRVSTNTSHHHYTPEGVPRWIPGPSNFHQDYHHQLQQPTTSRANATAPTAIQFQPSPHLTAAFFQQQQQLAAVGVPVTGMPVNLTAYFQQPQQPVSAGAPGTSKSWTIFSLFPHRHHHVIASLFWFPQMLRIHLLNHSLRPKPLCLHRWLVSLFRRRYGVPLKANQNQPIWSVYTRVLLQGPLTIESLRNPCKLLAIP